MGKGSKIYSSQSSSDKMDSSSCREEQSRARKGYVPVMVGNEHGMMERLEIPTKLVEHPHIVDLLEMSANEFGYGQEGLIKIRYDPDSFKQLVKRIGKEKRLDRTFSFSF